MKIFFIGTVEFSKIALQKLVNLNAEVVGVCTKEKSQFNSDYADLKPLCEKNKIPLHVLGRNLSNKNIGLEKEYFQRHTNNKVKFIHNYRGRKNFEIMDQFKYLIAVEGTLGIENLSRGGRSGFIFNRPNKKEYMSRRYGAHEGLKRKGPFWTSYNDKKEFMRVCKYLVFASEKSWRHSRKKYASKVMTRDKDNKKLLSIINKILNENKNQKILKNIKL